MEKSMMNIYQMTLCVAKHEIIFSISIGSCGCVFSECRSQCQSDPHDGFSAVGRCRNGDDGGDRTWKGCAKVRSAFVVIRVGVVLCHVILSSIVLHWSPE